MKRIVCVLAGLLLVTALLPGRAFAIEGFEISPYAEKFYKALKHTPSKPAPLPRIEKITPYDEYIHEASHKNQLDPSLVKAVIRQESNFNSWDVSDKGAVGLMQIMPETAGILGVKNSFNPRENIHGGTRYLKDMIAEFGDLRLALAAYNAGPKAVHRYGRIPPFRETRDYVKRVMQYYNLYRGSRLVSYVSKEGSLVITDSYIPKDRR